MNNVTSFGLLVNVSLFEMEPILDQIDLNEIGMLESVEELYLLESMEQLYSVEPTIEPIVFNPILEPEPLPERRLR